MFLAKFSSDELLLIKELDQGRDHDHDPAEDHIEPHPDGVWATVHHLASYERSKLYLAYSFSDFGLEWSPQLKLVHMHGHSEYSQQRDLERQLDFASLTG